jgi:hypothetical protein
MAKRSAELTEVVGRRPGRGVSEASEAPNSNGEEER